MMSPKRPVMSPKLGSLMRQALTATEATDSAEGGSPKSPARPSRPTLEALLDQSKASMHALTEAAAGKLVSDVLRKSAARVVLEGVDGPLVLSGVRGVFEQLSTAVIAATTQLADATQVAEREALKAQAVAFEMKLKRARTAGAMQLQNQAVEKDAEVRRRVEERVSEYAAGGGARLLETEKALEQSNEALSQMSLKWEGVTEALRMAQGLLNSSEAGAARGQSELSDQLEIARDQLEIARDQLEIARDQLEAERRAVAGLEGERARMEATLTHAQSHLAMHMEMHASSTDTLEKRLGAVTEEVKLMAAESEERRREVPAPLHPAPCTLHPVAKRGVARCLHPCTLHPAPCSEERRREVTI